MSHPINAYLMHITRRIFCGFVALFAAASMISLSYVNQISFVSPAFSQSVTTNLSSTPDVSPESQMLLESDDLIYDNDQQVVIATGNVQIAYDGHTLVAEKVTYDRQSGRVTAQGNVEILEPSGNRIFAEEIDITDDFADGFVAALNIETAENTRIAAESAERRDGEFTVFNNGVYTACKACEKDPTKPPLWQIRAKKVTINNNTRAIEYEKATFEFFGVPVLYLHRFAHANPAVKRKSGFLFPRYKNSDALGHSVRNSYYFNLAPNYDLTLSGTYYSRQGFLSEAEWRHRTDTGEYRLAFGKIDQNDPSAFNDSELSYQFIDETVTERKALATSGAFQINPRWRFGWNGLFQSDQNFARTYSFSGYGGRDITNQAYLVGLNGKNYFDLRAQDFIIQDQRNLDFNPYAPGVQSLADQQATLLPNFDYNIVSDEDVVDGQLSLDVNVAAISRDSSQVINQTDTTGGNALTPAEYVANERYHGIKGNYTRASANLEWKNSVITDAGAMVTASLGLRADGIFTDTDHLATEINPLTSNQSIFRGMPTGALEIRYPMVASTGFASHIFEPIAQLIVRPDETHIGEFPNEDAQSMVFDSSNLFDLDKYSGFDRVEGGSRANIGFRYSVNVEGGGGVDIVAGQSFHLAGKNSYDHADLVNAGLESGLETSRSDYVAGLQVDTGSGVTFRASGRFDEQSFEVRRAEVGTQITSPLASLSASYIFTDEQPLYALDQQRHEVSGTANVKISEHWRAFGSATYDIYNDSRIKKGIGLAYDDECYSFSVNYTESRSRTGDAINESIGFRFGLRTIGGHSQTFKLPSRDSGE